MSFFIQLYYASMLDFFIVAAEAFEEYARDKSRKREV